MPVLYAICIMKHNGAEAPPSLLCTEFDLSSFSFFKRPTVKELVTFFMRQVIQRTNPGEKNVVDEGDYVCHAFVTGDNLCCSVVTDKTYPTRVGLSLAALSLQEFKSAHSDSWRSARADTQLNTQGINSLLIKYQKPDEADNMSKIQKDLDDIKVILHKSMEDLLTRGERLESIIERSDDLSGASKEFLWQAKKNNSCCPSAYS